MYTVWIIITIIIFIYCLYDFAKQTIQGYNHYTNSGFDLFFIWIFGNLAVIYIYQWILELIK